MQTGFSFTGASGLRRLGTSSAELGDVAVPSRGRPRMPGAGGSCRRVGAPGARPSRGALLGRRIVEEPGRDLGSERDRDGQSSEALGEAAPRLGCCWCPRARSTAARRAADARRARGRAVFAVCGFEGLPPRPPASRPRAQWAGRRHRAGVPARGAGTRRALRDRLLDAPDRGARVPGRRRATGRRPLRRTRPQRRPGRLPRLPAAPRARGAAWDVQRGLGPEGRAPARWSICSSIRAGPGRGRCWIRPACAPARSGRVGDPSKSGATGWRAEIRSGKRSTMPWPMLATGRLGKGCEA